jgi:plastocyanin
LAPERAALGDWSLQPIVFDEPFAQGATMQFSIPRWGVAVTACVVLSGLAWASQEHVVSQKNKAFSVKRLTVKVGDTVKFVNEDSFAHNVFSLSAVKSFDLGSFGNGGNKTVTFEKPGKVEIECAVHPDMQMEIEVKP